MDNGYLILLFIAIVFLPGIIWSFIDLKFEPIRGYYRPSKPQFTFFVAKSFLFGVIVYLVLFIIAFVILIILFAIILLCGKNLWPKYVEIYHFLTNNKSLVPFNVMIIVTLTMILTPFIARCWFELKGEKWFIKLLLGSKNIKSSEELDVSSMESDIWTEKLVLGTSDYRVKVIDYNNKRVFIGNVDQHSGGEKLRELFLKFVYIYNFGVNPNDIEKSYIYCDYVYIDLHVGNICLEFIHSPKIQKHEKTTLKNRFKSPPTYLSHVYPYYRNDQESQQIIENDDNKELGETLISPEYSIFPQPPLNQDGNKQPPPPPVI